ncbi:MAG: hypothetical protein HKO59_10580 [Phycisphaerales bacterium]|nr:hypothetical protein [Phycisphaerae bacterium]NNF43751.1 hypothetical protein [Phycisphaerales bacterium]NNM26408.1 hypothetical protein [Phycisphaerales bacterium]
MSGPIMSGHDCPRPRPRPRRGISLIEAAFSLALVGGVLVASLTTYGAATRARHVRHDARIGDRLARDLLHEILQAQYREPDDPAIWGREAGETAADRSTWDDLDDYDGWSQSPPENRLGATLTGYDGWQRSARVVPMNVTPSTMTEGAATDTGVRKVEVTVTSPRGETHTSSAVRCDLAGLEQPPMLDRAYVSHVAYTLQVGPEVAERVSGSVNCINLRPPAPETTP